LYRCFRLGGAHFLSLFIKWIATIAFYSNARDFQPVIRGKVLQDTRRIRGGQSMSEASEE
jgi:hypothetical protein